MDAAPPAFDLAQDAPAAFHAASGCALPAWYVAIKNDPSRWAARMEKQRQRRALAGIRDAERKAERERWAKLPKDHPRKKRKQQRKPETVKAKRQRALERLTDGDVANRYLHMKVEDCPKPLIDLKREHIRLSRKLGTRIKSL
jgi:hypothetical protein